MSISKALQEDSLDYAFDEQHIWHPYTSMTHPFPMIGIKSADGCELITEDGKRLVDGTSSWWSCVHGYNHPVLISAIEKQLHQLPHVMFGGITHEPAIELAKKLVKITCPELTKVFLADSGSIAVEVAMKMALQYWQGKNNPNKQKIATIKRGYHGDTFAAMSVCDPDNGMHTMFGTSVVKQVFAPSPTSAFDDSNVESDLANLRATFETHHHQLAAFIIEPIMQGAGGMYFYSPEYLKGVRVLCDEFNILLILDEIATGFGRLGKLFAYEFADIAPDLMCIGKALTGGYISLAATMCSDNVAQGISDSPAGVFMHGPTFMGNPLACAAANASLELIAKNDWQQQIPAIEMQMQQELKGIEKLDAVNDVRVLGAVAVIEIDRSLNAAQLQPLFTEQGVWIRVFGHVIYIMPPYSISSQQLTKLTTAMKSVAKFLNQSENQTESTFLSHG
ncbi:adenosylmethionine--8-amino-7-oxononanoate transaminase [Shewanella sp. 202IG2-18]|uniref:adenosylmethionine--8-amino-7-oxononanoate transaminase n=1 Tax=Parashewanella hymeniacidonis TaxID=2807618 RepID=UPI00195F8E10|nr:adenosylmethionine--8-amino-7-oxononanoate transaminase [Parashewanella hymeniacidonis]MBM7070564.1 adenosylmethionine--8-amino-7-oxononanoate transaminase [Parashewanella hymeniacidonis]